MSTEDKALLAEAVNALIVNADAQDMFVKMRGVMELAGRGFPVQLTGAAATLNPLLRLALDSPDTYERVMELVERKRSERGLDALEPPDEGRPGYMRDFMRARRERLRRLVEAANLLRSDAEKIKGSARAEFERVHAARWMDEKDWREMILRAKLGRNLRAVERKDISTQLWADVDAEITAFEEFSEAEMRKPLTARSQSGFKYVLGSKKS
jgi:hypothetical protein